MSAPDPRLGEIEARIALSGDVDTWYSTEEMVEALEFAGADAGTVATDAEFIANTPADIAYLLAELRKRDNALARVEEQCVAADELASLVIGEDLQAGLRLCARGIRAAVTAAKGDG